MPNSPDIRSRLEELSGQDIESVLQAPLVPESKSQALGDILTGGSSENDRRPDWISDAAFAGITIGDLIYDITRIDPRAIRAADFSHAEDLSNVFEYSYFAERMSERSGNSLEGTLNREEGYVAERFAAQQQQSMGREVEVPDDANQEGYDLLINGEKFQVKSHSDPERVKEHLEEHPDIPVLVNQELAPEIGDHPDVYPVPGMDQEMIEEATASSLEAGAEVLDFEIPVVALAVVSGRQVLEMVKGNSDLKAAFPNVASELGGRVAGGYVGMQALAFAGMMFGPAGGVVGGLAGAVIGNQQGKKIAQMLRREILCSKEEQALQYALQEYLESMRKAAKENLKALERKQVLFEELLPEREQTSKVLKENFLWRLTQERKYRAQKAEDIQNALDEPERLDPEGNDLLVGAVQGARLMNEVGIHPSAVSSELSNLSEKSEILLNARKRYLT
jgi:hypothetical protein